jgi:hypothetical protein
LGTGKGARNSRMSVQGSRIGDAEWPVAVRPPQDVKRNRQSSSVA